MFVDLNDGRTHLLAVPVVLLMVLFGRPSDRRQEHRAVDKRRDAADEKSRPHHEHDDRPRGSEPFVEAVLEHIAQLHRAEREYAVREDDGPVDDGEVRQLVRAPPDGEHGHHDPRDAGAPKDV